MAHQAPERAYIASALPHESVRESVSKLMRRHDPHPGAFADACHHPPQGLPARSHLRTLAAPHAPKLRDPLLDLDSEDVIVWIRSQRGETCAQSVGDVGIDREPMPILSLA